MINRICYSFILLFFVVTAMAQELKIESFSETTQILKDANRRRDNNGNYCAVVEVMLPVEGASFVGNLVGSPLFKTNKYWVYLTEGSRNLQINVKGSNAVNVSFGDYGVKSLKQNIIYLLKVNGSAQQLTIKTTPPNAFVIIDGDLINMDNGQTVISLPLGNHIYNVVAEGYIKQQGEVKLTADAPGKLVIELDRKTDSNDQSQTVNTVSNSSSNSVLTYEVKGVTFEMIKVDGGTFTMGATSEMKDPYDYEKPTHQVTLTGNYYIGKTEVTQALWKAVMGDNPSEFKGDNLPVENISWNDCKKFITKLSTLTGKKFRLPTEAEWEFAARGGNKSRHYQYSGSNQRDDVTWYSENSDNRTHAVASKQPNELGIYDMSGNVWEWCSDYWGNYSSSSQTNPAGPNRGSNRVHRGGCWRSARHERSSCRDFGDPNYRSKCVGFRLALSQ